MSFSPPPPPSSPLPPPNVLAELYHHLPFIVACVSHEGVTVYCNPETFRITGYPATELIGHHFWATLFPGRLFAQVPRFITPRGMPCSPLLRDVPLTIRTRGGQERVIAFTRFTHSPGSKASPNGQAMWICIGVDLTDRLLDADRDAAVPPQMKEGAEAGKGTTVPFGPHVGDGGAIEGEFVTPLAISPPAPRAEGDVSDPTTEAVRQVHDFLTQMDARMAALEGAFERHAGDQLAELALTLHQGAHACGLLDFAARAERLHNAATSAQFEPAQAILREMLTICKPHRD